MRFAVALVACVLLAATSSAFAETRMFVIANQADGYGVDRCLAKGERCGRVVAEAFCQSRAFKAATAFHKIDADDVTGSVPAPSTACTGSACGEYVAITCQR